MSGVCVCTHPKDMHFNGRCVNKVALGKAHTGDCNCTKYREATA